MLKCIFFLSWSSFYYSFAEGAGKSVVLQARFRSFEDRNRVAPLFATVAGSQLINNLLITDYLKATLLWKGFHPRSALSAYACLDSGHTGCSLPLVSKFVHVSRPLKLQSIALHQIDAFCISAAMNTIATALRSISLHLRAQPLSTQRRAWGFGMCEFRS